MSYDIEQNLITRNFENTTLNPIGIVVHETATPGATALNIRNAFQRSSREASAHYSVDWDTIIEIVPPNKIAWHAGYKANHQFIGIELCRPYGHDEQKFAKVWDRGIWLFAFLFVTMIEVYTITKDNLMSHAEVSAKWHETTHTDPISYFAEYNRTVDDFRAAVQKEINSMIGDGKMDKIVIYYGDADLFAAVLVSQKNKCPLMLKSDFDASGIKVNKIIQIGGKPGTNRYDSFKEAAGLV